MAATSHPLDWPDAYPRTPARRRTRSTFKISARRAQVELLAEIARMDGRDAVISTDLRMRRSDGQPFARGLNRRSDDPGVAVYFRRGDARICVACDLHVQTWENIHAIGLTLQGINAAARHGASGVLDRALQGFAAPAPAPAPPDPGPSDPGRWHEILHVSPDAPAAVIGGAWRALSKQASAAAQLDLNLARDEGLAARGGGPDRGES